MRTFIYSLNGHLAKMLKPLGLCPVHFWWGLVFLIAILFSGKAMGQVPAFIAKKAYLEYPVGDRQRVTKAKIQDLLLGHENYWNEHYRIIGKVWDGKPSVYADTRGFEWIHYGKATNDHPRELSLVVDTSSNWNLLLPKGQDGKSGPLNITVMPVYLTNNGDHEAFIQLVEGNQLPLKVILASDEEKETRHQIKVNGISSGLLRIPPGGKVFTLFYPIKGAYDGLELAPQKILLMDIEGNALATSNTFTAYY